MATTLKARFVAFLAPPRLPLRLACVSTLLMLPSLGIGFHLDDYIHRYLLSDLPGASDLLRAYESPFGIANGERMVNHWQIEQGYAPWWTEPDLLVSLFRPLSELSHRIDAALWPNGSLGMHLHSLLWHFLFVWAATRLYLIVGGPSTVPAVAALLYALDHTHGFATGWIANRNALIAACLGAAALAAHLRWRRGDGAGWCLASVLSFGAALLSGEGAIAIFGFLVAHAVFLDRGGVGKRVLALVPHLAVVVAWRVAYTAAGRGAMGSGLYLDPMREPVAFAAAAVARVPVLLLGELALPPAELHIFAPAPWPSLITLLGVLFAALFAASLWPLLCARARARFWALGTAGALVVACTTHPHNRLLFFVGLGVMGLLSELWHGLLPTTGEGTRPPRPAGEAVGSPPHREVRSAHTTGEGTRPPRPAGEAVGSPPHREVRSAHTTREGTRAARPAGEAVEAPEAWVPASVPWRRVASPFTAAIVGFHLFLSPLLMPLSACSVALTAPAERGARQALAAGGGKELVLISSPDFFHAKLIRVIAALEGKPPPARLRPLSFGDVALTITRDDARSLRVAFAGGLLASPLLELYRARGSTMPVGTRVELEGMTVEVTRATADGRAAEARFTFDGDLEAPERVFLAWEGYRYVPWHPPRIGERVSVAPAELSLGL